MATIQPLTFGMLLKRYRRAAGMTQEALAARVNYSTTYISMLERGERVPQPATLEFLAEGLELTPAERTMLRATIQSPARMPSVPSTAPSPLHSRGALSAPIVGRADELILLEHHLAGEGPPALFLAGEPGIGKTRLLVEAAHMARDRDWCVLEGGCHRRGGQESYAPFLGTLERRIRGQPLARLRADLEGCAWLVRLLPELAEANLVPMPQWTLPAMQERRLMFAAVGRFLRNVALPSGTLLILDDLQWADADALDLLATLARSAIESPLRFVIAYRSTDVRPRDPLGVVQHDLMREDLATLHELGALPTEDARLLLAYLLRGEQGAEEETAAVRERVLQRAGGVPFFLVSCAQRLRAGTRAGGTGSATDADDVPETLAESIRQRVAALPKSAREVLRVAAIVGRVVPTELLVAVEMRGDEARRLTAIESLCRARLLIEDTQEESYRFSHDLVREVVEADMSAARRSTLHRQVAAALERRPGDPAVEQLAYHYLHSDEKSKALGYLAQAAAIAMRRHEHTRAEAYYRSMLDLAHGLGDRHCEAEALEQLGVLLDIVGRMDEARVVLERAVTTYRATGEVEGLRRSLARLGRVYRASAMPAEGLRLLEPFAARWREDSPSHGLAMLLARLAILYGTGGRYQEGLEVAERAAKMAEALHDNALVVENTRDRSQLLASVGRLQESLELVERTIPASEALDDPWDLCFLLTEAADLCQWRGTFEQSARHAERAVALGERMGMPGPHAYAVWQRGTLNFHLGDWEQAQRDYERIEALVRPLGAYWLAAVPGLTLGQLCLVRGDWEAAFGRLGEALAVAQRGGDHEILLGVQAIMAEWDLLAGHPEMARERLEPLLSATGAQDAELMSLLPLLAWSYRDCGELARADVEVSRSIAWETAQSRRLVLADALRVRALVKVSQSRWHEATDALDEALALCRAMPYPYAEAKALAVYGQLHLARGEPELAGERNAAALAILDRLGERLYAKQIEAVGG